MNGVLFGVGTEVSPAYWFPFDRSRKCKTGLGARARARTDHKCDSGCPSEGKWDSKLCTSSGAEILQFWSVCVQTHGVLSARASCP